MKKFKQFLTLILVCSISIFGCNKIEEYKEQRILELKLSDLETPCDYIDGAFKCDELVIKYANEKQKRKLDEKEIDLFMKLISKREQILTTLNTKFTKFELSECDQEKLKKFNEQAAIMQDLIRFDLDLFKNRGKYFGI